MKRLVLKDWRLSFVDVGAKLWHIKSTGGPPDNDQMDMSTRTIGACNIPIPSGQLVTIREMTEQEICGHCAKTAKRYNVKRYPEVWIEERES